MIFITFLQHTLDRNGLEVVLTDRNEQDTTGVVKLLSNPPCSQSGDINYLCIIQGLSQDVEYSLTLQFNGTTISEEYNLGEYFFYIYMHHDLFPEPPQ